MNRSSGVEVERPCNYHSAETEMFLRSEERAQGAPPHQINQFGSKTTGNEQEIVTRRETLPPREKVLKLLESIVI